MWDTVRGATKYIESDTTDAEDTNTEFLQSFNSDGFTVGNSGRVNMNGNQLCYLGTGKQMVQVQLIQMEI